MNFQFYYLLLKFLNLFYKKCLKFFFVLFFSISLLNIISYFSSIILVNTLFNFKLLNFDDIYSIVIVGFDNLLIKRFYLFQK